MQLDPELMLLYHRSSILLGIRCKDRTMGKSYIDLYRHSRYCSTGSILISKRYTFLKGRKLHMGDCKERRPTHLQSPCNQSCRLCMSLHLNKFYNWRYKRCKQCHQENIHQRTWYMLYRRCMSHRSKGRLSK